MGLRIHYFQHVPFEGLGSIEAWARARGHALTVTRLFTDDPLPTLDSFDWLIVMGGPMGVYEGARHPWLYGEVATIKAAIARGKRVLGICLGAQLIAAALDAAVYPGPRREIGWWPIEKTTAAGLLAALPDGAIVFHWHGDTFDLPVGAERLARSAGCANQAFSYGDRVLALQFHCDVTPEAMEQMVVEGAGELTAGQPYVQSAAAIRAGGGHVQANNAAMAAVLAAIEAAA